ncbi:MAG TPA: phage tail sheath subtilisin-like domain-containing protein [Polyangiaceae bacterium]
MALGYRTAGVYLQDVVVSTPEALQTSVPVFVGFGTARDGAPSPVVLEHAEELATRFVVAKQSFLAAAVTGFFANGGVRCYVVGAGADASTAALKSAIETVLPTLDVDLVAVPDAMAEPLQPEQQVEAQEVQNAVLRHCTTAGNRLAILDAPNNVDPSGAIDALPAWRDAICRGTAQPVNPADGTLYYPWLRVAGVGTTTSMLVPPCGHIAGIFARSDARVGVFKAPANEEIQGALDLQYLLDTATQDRLNPAGINCMRSFPGRGMRVWGARTLSLDPNWRYANVRRLVLTLSRWIESNMAWAPFETNAPPLWFRIQRELKVYLERLWRAGALQGATADEAFYVKCDTENNPASERELGQVTTEIGLAPALPAEFIVIRVIHRAGSSELS